MRDAHKTNTGFPERGSPLPSFRISRDICSKRRVFVHGIIIHRGRFKVWEGEGGTILLFRPFVSGSDDSISSFCQLASVEEGLSGFWGF